MMDGVFFNTDAPPVTMIFQLPNGRRTAHITAAVYIPCWSVMLCVCIFYCPRTTVDYTWLLWSACVFVHVHVVSCVHRRQRLSAFLSRSFVFIFRFSFMVAGFFSVVCLRCGIFCFLCPQRFPCLFLLSMSPAFVLPHFHCIFPSLPFCFRCPLLSLSSKLMYCCGRSLLFFSLLSTLPLLDKPIH